MSDLPERSDNHAGERFVLKYETPAGSLVELNGYAKFSIIFAAYELLCQATKEEENANRKGYREGTKLDDFNDRCIAEKWNEIND